MAIVIRGRWKERRGDKKGEGIATLIYCGVLACRTSAEKGEGDLQKKKRGRSERPLRSLSPRERRRKKKRFHRGGGKRRKRDAKASSKKIIPLPARMRKKKWRREREVTTPRWSLSFSGRTKKKGREGRGGRVKEKRESEA